MRKQIITETWARAQSGLLGAFYVCCFWGEQQHLDSFLQRYAVEKSKIEARRRGHSVTESQLSDGSVKLTINVGG
jgi:hypothetical protein